ncbi:hypothetical protein L2E82_47266 [Cichorium intybus]|uniref:Uncharacterized protein n=1 Tax=Cichorium intybus TaxID=13427 RepID=A0ACB8YUW0_CICIN|nr:hypothetical protein L2E82_47266 [Cichorium intybus]
MVMLKFVFVSRLCPLDPARGRKPLTPAIWSYIYKLSLKHEICGEVFSGELPSLSIIFLKLHTAGLQSSPMRLQKKEAIIVLSET